MTGVKNKSGVGSGGPGRNQGHPDWGRNLRMYVTPAEKSLIHAVRESPYEAEEVRGWIEEKKETDRLMALLEEEAERMKGGERDEHPS